MTINNAPGYSYNPYTDDNATQPLSEFCMSHNGCYPRVDCSDISWEFDLANQAPDDRQLGPVEWRAVVGPMDLYGRIAGGGAPEVQITPASGILAPGQHTRVRVSGSFGFGPLFGVSFGSDHGDGISASDGFKCR